MLASAIPAASATADTTKTAAAAEAAAAEAAAATPAVCTPCENSKKPIPAGGGESIQGRSEKQFKKPEIPVVQNSEKTTKFHPALRTFNSEKEHRFRLKPMRFRSKTIDQ
jgi:hypothetical protein